MWCQGVRRRCSEEERLPDSGRGGEKCPRFFERGGGGTNQETPTSKGEEGSPNIKFQPSVAQIFLVSAEEEVKRKEKDKSGGG